MQPTSEQKIIIQELQQKILSMQGFKTMPVGQRLDLGLGAIQRAFPESTFPTGAVHEFLSFEQGDAAATNGFITGLISRFMKQGGVCLWISTRRAIYPPALKLFGIAPERIIFLDLVKEKEVLWAVEQALKCEALAAVVGELKELTFTESQRLQLAVEQSRVTGFIHRFQPKTQNPVACVSRWKIRSVGSIPEENMPGVGFPQWDVQLIKIRNGHPGSWEVAWAAEHFRHIPKPKVQVSKITTRKAG